MNLKDEVIKFHQRYKPIPKPFYVVRADDHFMVCILDENFNLIKEVSNICWDVWRVRRWAFEFASRGIK